MAKLSLAPHMPNMMANTTNPSEREEEGCAVSGQFDRADLRAKSTGYGYENSLIELVDDRAVMPKMNSQPGIVCKYSPERRIWSCPA